MLCTLGFPILLILWNLPVILTQCRLDPGQPGTLLAVSFLLGFSLISATSAVLAYFFAVSWTCGS